MTRKKSATKVADFFVYVKNFAILYNVETVSCCRALTLLCV